MRVSSCFCGGAVRASRQEERDEQKRACRPVFFHPSRGVKVLSNRDKAKCEQNDGKLHEEIFAADGKIQSM